MLPPVAETPWRASTTLQQKMAALARSLRPKPMAIAGLACLVLLCLISFGDSFKIVGTTDSATEQAEKQLDKRVSDGGNDTSPNPSLTVVDKLGIPGLLSIPNIPGLGGGASTPAGVPVIPSVLTYPTVVPTPTQQAGGGLGGLLSIVGSVLSVVPQPTAIVPLPLPLPTSDLGGGILPIPTIVPLPSLTDVLPLPVPPAPEVTPNPATTEASGGLLGGLLGLGNVVSAIDGVVGQSGNGLLDQLTSGVLAPLDAILSDPVAILADPTSALANIQSQVATILDTLPSAVAAGAQVVDDLGGQLASAVSDVPALLTAVPAVGDGLGGEVGSLVNIVPSIAAALPEAAMSIVDQVGSLVSAVPGIGPDLGGALDDLTNQLSSQVVYILPEATSLVGDLVDHITSILPPEVGSIVGGLASVVQSEVSGVLCQVSSVVEGTAIIFNVPCSELATSAAPPVSSPVPTTPGPATVPASTTGLPAPTAASPSVTGIPGTSSLIPPSSPSTLGAPTSSPAILSSILSRLSSSLASLTSPSVNNIMPTPATTGPSTSAIPLPLASSIASALSSVMSQPPLTPTAPVSNILPSLSSLLSQVSMLSQTAAIGGSSASGPLATAGPMLSSLASQISSMMTQAVAPAAPASSVGSVLSSIISALSTNPAASVTAGVPTPVVPLPSPPISQPPPPPGSSTAATTVYYVRTITELLTSTSVQVITQCTSTAPIPPAPCPSGTSAVSPTTASPLAGPCPGQGYSCDSCIDGWFCPPQQTPALPAPCGLGWPCYHCSGGWFCVPSRALASPVVVSICPATQASVFPTPPLPATMPSIAPPAQAPSATPLVPRELSYPAVNGYQYAGCYVDSPARALGNQMPGPVNNNMTNGMCIDYCTKNSFTLAATENGTQCFCGNQLLGSYLLGDEACNMTCTGEPSANCGGAWALSLYSPNRDVPQAQGPAGQFSLANTPGGQHPGGVRQTILPVVTPIYAWPAPAPPPPAPPASSPTSPSGMTSSANVVGLQSTMSSIVSQAISEASQVMDSELAKASSVLGDAESILSQGMSSIAINLSSIASVAQTAIGSSSAPVTMPSPAGVPVGPGPVIPSTSVIESVFGSTLPTQTASAALLPNVSATQVQGNTETNSSYSSTLMMTVRQAQISSSASGLWDRWHRRRAY